MSLDVWIGVFVSIPVSVGVGLALPYIQRWIKLRGKSTQQKKRARIDAEYREVLYYALHTDMMIGKLVISVITLLSLIIPMIVLKFAEPTLFDAVDALIPHKSTSIPYRTQSLIVAASFALAFVGTVFVTFFSNVRESVRLFFNVKYFKDYIKSIPDDMRNKAYETMVLNAMLDRAVPEATRRIWAQSEDSAERENDPNKDASQAG
jgi:ABC-type Fe3+ transport system permease subunit